MQRHNPRTIRPLKDSMRNYVIAGLGLAATLAPIQRATATEAAQTITSTANGKAEATETAAPQAKQSAGSEKFDQIIEGIINSNGKTDSAGPTGIHVEATISNPPGTSASLLVKAKIEDQTKKEEPHPKHEKAAVPRAHIELSCDSILENSNAINHNGLYLITVTDKRGDALSYQTDVQVSSAAFLDARKEAAAHWHIDTSCFNQVTTYQPPAGQSNIVTPAGNTAQQSAVSTEAPAQFADQLASPGVVLVSPGLQIVYYNGQWMTSDGEYVFGSDGNWRDRSGRVVRNLVDRRQPGYVDRDRRPGERPRIVQPKTPPCTICRGQPNPPSPTTRGLPVSPGTGPTTRGPPVSTTTTANVRGVPASPTVQSVATKPTQRAVHTEVGRNIAKWNVYSGSRPTSRAVFGGYRR